MLTKLPMKEIIKSRNIRLKQNIRQFINYIKKLKGDPHYVAMGMAIGVFVSTTPTIPFHIPIAIALAFVLRGSKPAAAIGVWFCNPFTLPFLYLWSYKVGMFVLGNSAPFDTKYESITELFKLGLHGASAMIIGGAIIGVLPGIAVYLITRKIFTAIRLRSKKSGDHNPKLEK